MERTVKLKFQLREKAMKERMERKDEIIKAYLETVIPDGKTQLCRDYLRGFCMFTENECHFAHTIQNLIFKKPDLEEYLKKNENLYANGPLLKVDETEEEERVPDKKHHGLYLKRSYKVLYEYQFKLIERGELEKPYTLQELDSNRACRQPIRDLLHRELQQEFVYLLFKEYNTPYLPKGFVSLCFKSIAWFSRFKKLINGHCCYEILDPKKGIYISRLPQGREFEILFEGCLIKLFKKYGLINKIPIPTSEIQRLYRDDIMKEDPYKPDIYWFVVQKGLQLDDILQEYQANENFVRNLCKELELKESELLGKPIFKHEKQSNLQKRDEIVKIYSEREVNEGKSQLCRFFMRGLCIFDAQTCKFAHGIKDLSFKQLDIEELEKGSSNKKKDEDYKIWEKKWADILKERQPSLNLEFTYKILYEYQEKLLEEGRITRKFTIEELNADENIRKDIRVLMHVDLTKEFVNYLFDLYKKPYLKRGFVDKCFQSIGWMTNWNRILDEEFCFEVKLPEVGFVICKIPPLSVFTPLIENALIEIIRDNKLLTKLPITPNSITKFFYKDIAPRDPLLPTLHVYLKKIKKSLEEYLKELQLNKDFIWKLSVECEVPYDEIKDKVIFDSSDSDLQLLMEKVEKTLQDIIEKSHLGFFLYSRFEEAVQKRCKKELEQFNNNYSTIRKMMKAVALYSGVLVVNLTSETYLFSIPKFLTTNVDSILGKYIKKLNNKCSRKPTKQQEQELKVLISEDTEPRSSFKLTEQELNEEIDLSKIMVIDSEETLQKAEEIMKGYDSIGIDLEGNLSREGMIELVQCAVGDMILIFDVFKAKSIDEKLHEKMISHIRKMMEDSKICKVFHDCRKDSLALHLFMHCCPTHSFDVSGVYTLIEHLKIYAAFKDLLILPHLSQTEKKEGSRVLDDFSKFREFVESVSEVLKLIDELRAPGLNDVLLAYGATHGVNRLKAIMKKRFSEMPREYFIKRPIDREFLIYSAKDVEDLVEVKKNMENKLKEVVSSVLGDVDERKILLLAGKVSKTYALYGCSNC